MLKTGPKTVKDVPGGFEVRLVSDGPFTIYAVKNRKDVAVIGPASSERRTMRFKVPRECDGFRVECGDLVHWSYVDNQPQREVLDNKPVEFIPGPASLTIQEQVRELVQQEFSRIAEEQGMESFDEAMDFDVAEDDEFVSPYEIEDMVPEEIESAEGEREAGRAGDDSATTGENAPAAAGAESQEGPAGGPGSGAGGRPPEAGAPGGESSRTG